MRYVYYFLKDNQNKIYKLQKGIAQPHVYSKDLMALKIPLPPLSTQKRIVSILEQAEKLKQNRDHADKLTKEYLQSVFYEMFGDPLKNENGWAKYSLGEICESFQNGIGKNIEYYGKGHKVANIGDLYDWHKFSPIKYSFLEVTDKEIDLYKLERGDILFVRSSLKPEGVAYCSMYDSNELCLFSSFMIRIKPIKNKISSEFLAFLLRTPYMRKELIKASNTVTITNISQPNLKKVEVICPPLPLQQKFASIVEHVEKLKEKQKQSKEEIDNLFSSLMSKSFKGGLI